MRLHINVPGTLGFKVEEEKPLLGAPLMLSAILAMSPVSVMVSSSRSLLRRFSRYISRFEYHRSAGMETTYLVLWYVELMEQSLFKPFDKNVVHQLKSIMMRCSICCLSY